MTTRLIGIEFRSSLKLGCNYEEPSDNNINDIEDLIIMSQPQR